MPADDTDLPACPHCLDCIGTVEHYDSEGAAHCSRKCADAADEERANPRWSAAEWADYFARGQPKCWGEKKGAV